MKQWQTKSSRIVYENPWISVREDQTIRPDGSDGIYGVVSGKHSGVFVIPVDEDGYTYIVLQERYTIERDSWEIVAGGMDDDSYEQAAKRELLEEAGIQADTIEKVSEFYLANGFSSAKGIICIATGLKKVSSELDAVDGINAVRKVSFDEIKDMTLKGEITDGPTLTAVYTVLAYLEKQKA